VRRALVVLLAAAALAVGAAAGDVQASARPASGVCAIPGVGTVACSSWHWSRRVMYRRPCEGRIPLVGPIFASHQSYPPSDRNC
jgi:hypothetical protein